MVADEQRGEERAAQPDRAREDQPGDAEPARVADERPSDAPARSGMSRRNLIVGLVVGVVVLDVLAFLFIPPYPKGNPGQPVTGISDLINANLEFPAPEIVWPTPHDTITSIISFYPSITNTILTSWIVAAVILVLTFLASRGMTPVPNRLQNAIEFVWESLENWAISLGGEAARKHIPLFAAFFLFILFSNWSGLIPIFGKFEFLRAPTSDVNTTIGLALVVFVYFQFQGFRTLGITGYLSKFFPFGAFRDGIGAGAIGVFVGFIEFMLEFIKPVTLSMRLFGNIFGGEVALGVITSLTIAVLPAAMLLLEGLLNFVQALIFSTLMLMYTIIAVESHGGEEHHEPVYAEMPEGNIAPPVSGAEPAH